MTTRIDRLHETPGHVESTLGCKHCRTFCRVSAGYGFAASSVRLICFDCGTSQHDVYTDIVRLGDFVDTRGAS